MTEHPATGQEDLERFEGTLLSGVNQGASFVGLGWVRTAIRRAVGFDPYPGTLNLRLVDAEALSCWRTIRATTGARLTPPEPGACGGRLIPALVDDRVHAAVVVPDITRYGDEVLEIVAPVHLRSHLALRDGDRVRLTIPRSSRAGAAQRASGTPA